MGEPKPNPSTEDLVNTMIMIRCSQLKRFSKKKNIAKERLAQELSSFAFLIVSTQSTIQN